MKKGISYLMVSVFGMFLFLTNVRALSPHAEEILDIISKDRKINITDFSVLSDKYLNPDNDNYIDYFSVIIDYYVQSLPEVQQYLDNHPDHHFDFSVHCLNRTACGIEIYDSEEPFNLEEYEEKQKEYTGPYLSYLYEHFDVSINTQDYVDNNVYDYIRNRASKLQNETDQLLWTHNYLFDLGYINYWYNDGALVELFNKEKPGSDNFWKEYDEKVEASIKYFPNIKATYENMNGFKYEYSNFITPVMPYSTSINSTKTAALYFTFYNNVIYSLESVGLYTAPVILISNKTSDSSIIEAAKSKIDGYIGNSKINVNLEYISKASEENIKDLSEFMNRALKTNIQYSSDKYKLTIGDKETDLYIVKVPEEYVNIFNTKSYSLNTGIEMTTTGLDVPFDSSLEVKDITKDYKEDESIVVAYDINLYSLLKDGYVTKSQNGFKIMIPVDDDFKEENKKIYYIDSDGKKEKYDFSIETIDNKKYVTFVTNHLSTYAIAEEINEDVENNTGNTGNTDKPIDNPHTGIVSITSLIFIGLIGGTTLYLSKKKNKVHKI